MNWKKIDKTEKMPSEPFIYTDGKRITVAGKDIYGLKNLYIGDNASLDQATHYVILRDLPMPLDACRSKCRRCCN